MSNYSDKQKYCNFLQEFRLVDILVVITGPLSWWIFFSYQNMKKNKRTCKTDCVHYVFVYQSLTGQSVSQQRETKSSSPDFFNRWQNCTLHLLTKFLKAQQSYPIQVFGLKIIRCSIFQRCTFPKALLIALCPLLGRIMIIFHIVLGVMHRKFNTQKVNAIN